MTLTVHAADIRAGGQRLVDALELVARPGEFWGILGPNGAGKTTLLLTLTGVRSPAAGTILLDGKALAEWPRRRLAQRLGLLPQHIEYAFDADCLQTALIGRHPHLGPLQRESRADHDRARQALDDVGLAARAERSCLSLSGGESRRLSLATLLVQDPRILLLDEPTNHLDPAHQVQILNHLWRLVIEQQRTIVAALHDVNLATCYCSHVLLLFDNGRWQAGPTAQLLEPERLSELYGCPVRLVDDGRQKVFAVAGPPLHVPRNQARTGPAAPDV